MEVEVQVPHLVSINTQGWGTGVPAPYMVSTDTAVGASSLLLSDGESPHSPLASSNTTPAGRGRVASLLLGWSGCPDFVMVPSYAAGLRELTISQKG